MGGNGVASLIEQLPRRFLGASDLPPTRYRIRAGRTVRDVVAAGDSCTVGAQSGRADAEIVTDPKTWGAIDAGRLSGIEAFAARRLFVRGSIERALEFEPLFERPHRGGLRYSIEQFDAGGVAISGLTAGDEGAEPLILLHGLGATKASWLTAIPHLSRRHRVIAIDLPGFGASSKPVATYDARFFADRVVGLLNALDYRRALVAGNSMGGKIAMEMAMSHPGRVSAIACLCPATAFSYQPALWLARLIRPEVGLFFGRLPRRQMRRDLRRLFADPDRIDDSWYEAAIDDFLRTWKSPRARLAFSSALRHLYLEQPDGENGFWRRLAKMGCPALYIYGEGDVLITPRFGRKVSKVLPGARVVVWPDCGHAPQLELPERTAAEMIGFFAASVERRAAV
ncbi:MAG: alpha/beta fold hydrolase [Actinomycetota bacterium]